jgi:hypothetical protein
MASTSETGHAVNLINFQELIKHIVSFGPKYNPVPDRLKYETLNTVHLTATATFEHLNNVNAPYLTAISNREAAFLPIKGLLSRINKTAEILFVNPVALKAIKEIIRKLRGERAVAKKKPEEVKEGEKATVYRSVSQLSFEQRIEHFDELIRLLQELPEYAPNETELTPAYLNTLLIAMKTTNTDVVDTSIPVVNARNARNKILYEPVNGIVSLANDVKKYVLAAFGINSEEYRAVQKLKFTKTVRNYI